MNPHASGVTFALAVLLSAHSAAAGQRDKVSIPSSVDGNEQPCYVILPEGFDPDAAPVPLLVSLHTWSGSVEQRQENARKIARR